MHAPNAPFATNAPKMLNVELKVTENKLYQHYVDLLNPFLDLPKRERRVLANILLLYYKNKHIPEIDSLILAKDAKKAIRTSLNLSEASLYNSIAILKKKGCINGKQLNKSLIRYPEDKKLVIKYELHVI